MTNIFFIGLNILFFVLVNLFLFLFLILVNYVCFIFRPNSVLDNIYF